MLTLVHAHTPTLMNARTYIHPAYLVEWHRAFLVICRLTYTLLIGNYPLEIIRVHV